MVVKSFLNGFIVLFVMVLRDNICEWSFFLGFCFCINFIFILVSKSVFKSKNV